MNYNLNKSDGGQRGGSLKKALNKLAPMMTNEKKNLLLAFLAIALNVASNLSGPILIAYTVDHFIVTGNMAGILKGAGLLLGIYGVGLMAAYFQITRMGGVGRRVLFNLRNAIFNKLQGLPITFFNQNKSGDLISRINNDTDKLNQFFSQGLMQFVGNFFLMAGACVLLLNLNTKLGIATLIPAILVMIITRLISSWVRRKNLGSLKSLGGLSAEIQESLENFKVIAAFNRQDYFRDKFAQANERNYSASVGAGVAGNIFIPIYGMAANLGQLVVLTYGIYLITIGQLTVGLLIGFLLYANNFYMPLRQLASIWSTYELALAAMDRIWEVLSMASTLTVIPSEQKHPDLLMEFKHVSFSYDSELKEKTLNDVDLQFKKGHTYALVGPTGGGKTTTASLMARLYDPAEGVIMLNGKDLRSYEPEERSKKIGFILQEPFLFTGTVRDNILYGNQDYGNYSNNELLAVLESLNLSKLLTRFEQGLDTPVSLHGGSISLGQRQLIAFIRAIIRKPELLILDEATANIDTVTEQLLEEILSKLPPETTRIIIAHRLNTIRSADQIFFVGVGRITAAGSMEHALEMLLHHDKKS